MGSCRSSISVVPAWFASPVNSNRYRPCGQIELATPTAAPSSTSPRPCSTCSSTNAAIRSSSGDGPTPAASMPDASSAARNVVPDRSVSPSARSAGSAPTATRDPRHGIPNREPSSSTNASTPIGTRGTKPSARNRSTAASADTTPSGPSKAPPSITESRWLPVTIPLSTGCREATDDRLGEGGSHQATRLPMPSDSSRRPRDAHWSVNQCVAARSAGVQPPRWYPPESGSFPMRASSAHIVSNDSAKGVLRQPVLGHGGGGLLLDVDLLDHVGQVGRRQLRRDRVQGVRDLRRLVVGEDQRHDVVRQVD